MKTMRLLRFIVAVHFVVGCLGVSKAGADILGIEWKTGLVYQIDPITGAATPDGQRFILDAFGASSSPQAQTIYATSGINLWALDLNTGVETAYGYFNNFPLAGIADLALDPQSGTLYGRGDIGQLGEAALFTIDAQDCQCPQPTNLIGPMNADIYAMGFVPGGGLYGVDTSGSLYSIDITTGFATLIGPTGISGVGDITYDSQTGELIVTVIGPPWNGVKTYQSMQYLGPGSIYEINWHTGQATLLNDNAPDMFALADTTPEPAPWLLLATALLGLAGLTRLERAVRTALSN